MKTFALLAGAGVFALLVTPAAADTLGLVPSAVGGYGNPVYDYGFSFHVNSPIEVTALAHYEDSDPDPLQSSHLVRLWLDTGPDVPLVSATVSPADAFVTVQSGLHNFYYSPIAPLLLLPGDYVISGTPGQFDTFFTANGVTNGPEITLIDGRYGDAGGGRPPGIQGLANFGGNFLYNAVPEPSAGLLLASGATIVAAIMFHRRRKYAN